MRPTALTPDNPPPPTRLYLVRHGRVADGHTDRYHGHNDIPLSPEGKRQLVELARQLQDIPLAAVFASDLARARDGAARLSEGRNLEVRVVPEFREVHFGVWEGLTFQEIATRYPRELEGRLNDLAGYRIPGGESLKDVQDRVIPRLTEILAQFQGQNVALVAHAGVNRVILCHALGLSLSHFFRLDQNYGCLNIIDYFPDFTVVRLINGGVNGFRH
jgi:alpha-ribazole phosphatase|uniref:Alpha-ribazole phosphatase n=1 Tax=Desulfobacca acetoxidans TaxID=60893 RepID=A0A7C5AM09_9BACT